MVSLKLVAYTFSVLEPESVMMSYDSSSGAVYVPSSFAEVTTARSRRYEEAFDTALHVTVIIPGDIPWLVYSCAGEPSDVSSFSEVTMSAIVAVEPVLSIDTLL